MKIKKDDFALNYTNSHGGERLSDEELKTIKSKKFSKSISQLSQV